MNISKSKRKFIFKQQLIIKHETRIFKNAKRHSDASLKWLFVSDLEDKHIRHGSMALSRGQKNQKRRMLMHCCNYNRRRSSQSATRQERALHSTGAQSRSSNKQRGNYHSNDRFWEETSSIQRESFTQSHHQQRDAQAFQREKG